MIKDGKLKFDESNVPARMEDPFRANGGSSKIRARNPKGGKSWESGNTK